MFDFLAGTMDWFYGIWPSYGGAIILLTLAVMLVLTPLTLRGTRSMLRMQRLQPEMKRIQKEFKDDRQRQNEELMAFYKENGINPLSSCLPLLIQMPVFIVLYQVLSGLTRLGPDTVLESGETVRFFDPKYLTDTSALGESLRHHTEMNFLGFDLAISPSEAFGKGFGTFVPYAIMIVIVLVSGYVQQAQIQGRSQNQNQNPQQQMIMKILPAFIGVISFGLPGALVLYFVTSNLFRVGQQFLITRTIYAGEAVAAGVIEADSEEKPKSQKAVTEGNGAATKGRPTPPRSSGKAAKGPGAKGPAKGSGSGSAGNGLSKGKNKRTSSGRSGGANTPSLPQPRPRKKKR